MNADQIRGISSCSYSQCEGREFDPPPRTVTRPHRVPPQHPRTSLPPKIPTNTFLLPFNLIHSNNIPFQRSGLGNVLIRGRSYFT
jgi:hypothetical protein